MGSVEEEEDKSKEKDEDAIGGDANVAEHRVASDVRDGGDAGEGSDAEGEDDVDLEADSRIKRITNGLAFNVFLGK